MSRRIHSIFQYAWLGNFPMMDGAGTKFSHWAGKVGVAPLPDRRRVQFPCFHVILSSYFKTGQLRLLPGGVPPHGLQNQTCSGICRHFESRSGVLSQDV